MLKKIGKHHDRGHKVLKKTAPIFVVQRHDAKTLHYDFRLEIDGTLVSWSVPKGISTVANEKHLALRMANHPLDYADFEGVIPEGQYGAGSVKIWDKGTFEPVLDQDETMKQALKSGSFKFNLHGKKLKGGYAMAMMDEKDGQENWIIFKLKDQHAKPANISHPDKLLFPKSDITKDQVAQYYERIVEHMLPHIKNRPLTLRRYPGGIGKVGFFNKHAPDYFPPSIKRIAVPMHSEPGEVMHMASAGKAEDLAYFAAQNTVEIHMGLSKAAHLEKPDQVVFDLDAAPDGDFEKVRDAALALKAILDDLRLPAFVKTTGSKGVHVHIPITPKQKFPKVKAFAKQIGQKLNDALPDITTLEHRINKRGNKVYIDILRNDYGMTVIAPYALRAIEGAPVATPVDWAELKNKSLGAQSYNLGNIFRRLAHKQDPWSNFYSTAVAAPMAELSLKSQGIEER